MAYAVNNEEVNSWNTGVNSEWFNTLISEVMRAQKGSDVNACRRGALRAHAGAGLGLHDGAIRSFRSRRILLTSRLGYGMVIKGYGAGREANSEFFAKFGGSSIATKCDGRRMYDAGYGGDTIAAWFAGQHGCHRRRRRPVEHALAVRGVIEGRFVAPAPDLWRSSVASHGFGSRSRGLESRLPRRRVRVELLSK